MKSKIKICDKCKANNIKTLLLKLQKLDVDIEVGCTGFCGIGRTKIVAILDNVPIIKDNETDLIESIKQALK